MPQPTKKCCVSRNTSGLRNQNASAPSGPHIEDFEGETEGQETPQAFGTHFDSTCVDWSSQTLKEMKMKSQMLLKM